MKTITKQAQTSSTPVCDIPSAPIAQERLIFYHRDYDVKCRNCLLLTQSFDDRRHISDFNSASTSAQQEDETHRPTGSVHSRKTPTSYDSISAEPLTAITEGHAYWEDQQQHDGGLNMPMDEVRRVRRRAKYGRASAIYHCWSGGLTFGVLLIGMALALALPATAARRVVVDWTLESDLFNRGNTGIKTKYVRMNDILSIRCAPVISLKIYMVPKESALFCRAPAAKDEDGDGRRLRQTIGTCAPNSSSPTVKVRATALANSPVFQPRQSYFLITTSTGTSEGMENSEGGLCQKHGMRLRLVVVDENDPLPGDEITNFDEIFPNLRSHNSPTHSRPEGGQREGVPPFAEDRDYQMPPSRRKSSYSSPSLRQAPPPDPSSEAAATGGYTWPRRRITVATGNKPHTASEETGAQMSSYPAVLTLEENGRTKTIKVYNSRQLQEEINYASERNYRIQHVREFSDYNNLPEYSTAGHTKISALPISAQQRPPINVGGRARHTDDGETRVWQRSAAGRRNSGSRSQPDDADDSSEIGAAAYSSSLKATASGTAERDRSAPAGSVDGGRHLPFTYVVGYNSADSTYGDTDGDEMLLDVPASSANGFSSGPAHVLLSAVGFFLAVHFAPRAIAL